MTQLRIGMLLTLALVALAITAPPCYAKRKGRLSPAKVKQIKTTNKNFKQCQKKAVRDGRQQQWSAKKVKESVSLCRERFPAASLHIECKRDALKENGRNPARAKAAIQKCRDLLLAASFDPTVAVPVLVYDKKLFFSGIGLNQESLLENLDPPNFSCTRLRQAVAGEGEFQYVLFGNEPKIFDQWSNLPEKRRAKIMSFADEETEKELPRLGQLVKSEAQISLYFGSAACDFESETGKYFEGISTYYLRPIGSDTVVPYFGIGYFKPDQERFSHGDVAKILQNKLGAGYEIYKKNDHTSFIAAAPVDEFDGEGDPMNLCRRPLQHLFLGVVSANEDSPSEPTYLLVANVRNLCRYGDRVIQKLAAASKP